ncbi:hypothetical protein L211DRAFT_853331 [Terfezia boudieri ATCC MYA-4762]|uniref:Uncharacterized protein n=1 Tax=Terfezia boudieri ATCC MYA-4762 TaxID=1051890 RepID=A0A3N4L8V0_9PEZI|nr:hypothetical protein L211DRAFT_853331 [Terfezia boudieri ATCC MYA-4762]
MQTLITELDAHTSLTRHSTQYTGTTTRSSIPSTCIPSIRSTHLGNPPLLDAHTSPAIVSCQDQPYSERTGKAQHTRHTQHTRPFTSQPAAYTTLAAPSLQTALTQALPVRHQFTALHRYLFHAPQSYSANPRAPSSGFITYTLPALAATRSRVPIRLGSPSSY